VLLSGHHENIRRWRRRQALKRTLLHRPELLENVQLDREDRRTLDELRAELGKEE
jgi:tRNA (guanine37-N1)-methyltransferase